MKPGVGKPQKGVLGSALSFMRGRTSAALSFNQGSPTRDPRHAAEAPAREMAWHGTGDAADDRSEVVAEASSAASGPGLEAGHALRGGTRWPRSASGSPPTTEVVSEEHHVSSAVDALRAHRPLAARAALSIRPLTVQGSPEPRLPDRSRAKRDLHQLALDACSRRNPREGRGAVAEG